MERVQQEQDKRRQHTGSEDSNLVGVLPSATVDVDRRKEGEGKDEGKKLRIKKKIVHNFRRKKAPQMMPPSGGQWDHLNCPRVEWQCKTTHLFMQSIAVAPGQALPGLF